MSPKPSWLWRQARRAYHLATQAGWDPRQTWLALRGWPAFIRDVRRFRDQRPQASEFSRGLAFPCLADRFETAGTARGHYFHQDLWAARRVFANRPQRHVDVGSRLDGFVAHVAAFRELEVLDIRPAPARIPNVIFRQADLMSLSPDLEHGCDSLSCLHALEHFGLGRYGDPVRWDGHLAGWESLYRLLKPGGKLYFSVPMGPTRIEFDAHRIFAAGYWLARLPGRYRLDAFSYVNDAGELVADPVMDEDAVRENFGCWYGCGLFELTKLA